MRSKRLRRCSYLVPMEAASSDEELQVLASYLSTLHPVNCDIVILDPAPADRLEQRRRILRWVGRHIAVSSRHFLPNGEIDVLEAAAEFATCEKVIVAAPESRYRAEEITTVYGLLDHYEAVEPEEFVEPLPWWGAIDAGRMLLHRGLDQPLGGGRTFAFRRSSWRPLRGVEERERGDHVRRLVMNGVEVHPAPELFVRRETPRFPAWARLRAREAAAYAGIPVHTSAFAGVIPVLAILGLVGGLELAGSYAGIIALASLMIAVRGRAGVGRFFPLRACLFAPLWLAERSMSVYWAMFARLRRVSRTTASGTEAQAMRHRAKRG